MYKSFEDWASSLEYVGMEITTLPETWQSLDRSFLYQQRMSKDHFDNFLKLCKIKWSFSKL